MGESSAVKSRATKVLVGCVLIIAIEYGTLNIMSNYISAICEQTGASAVQVSLLFSIASAVSVLAGLAAAIVIEKVPMRLIMMGGSASFILFFMLLYFADGIIPVYIGSVFYGLTQVFIGFTVCQPLITWWHTKNVGKKLSALSAAMSVGAMILSPAVASLLNGAGYHAAILFNGGVLGVALILCVVFLVSNRPESYGLSVSGADGKSASDSDSQQAAVAKPEGISAKQALRTYPFWAILIGASLLMIPANGFVTNASVIFQSCGFDAVTAGTMISVYSACAIAWVLVYGVISDRFGPRLANIVYTCASFVILGSFYLIGGMVGSIILVATFGIVTSYGGMIGAVTFGTIYGPRAIGSLVPLCLVGTGIGATFAAPIASAINEATGGYEAFMGLGAVLCVVILVLFATATSRAAVERVRAIEPE